MKVYQKIQREHHFAYPNVFSLFYHRYQETPDQLFLISLHHEAEARYTYRQFFNKVLKVRAFLQEKNLAQGDAINLIIQNSADFLTIYFAAFSLGIIVCPINYNFTPKEMMYIIRDSQGKMLFVDEEYLPKVQELEPELGGRCPMVMVSNDRKDTRYISFAEIFNAPETAIDENVMRHVTLDDKAVIIYTSGTSGNPKGAILTHANLLADAQAIAEWFKFNQTTRTLCILPLFHNNGQVVTLLAPLWAGGSTVMIKGNITLKNFWDFVKRYEVTWSSVIPTILSVLLNFKIKRTDNTMQGIICGGALLPQRVQMEFEEKFQVPIYEGYGLTETTSFSCFNPREISDRKIGSIGRSLPINEMAILDENGDELPPNKIGEICIRGYNVFLEYCNLPERNARAFQNGWFHSGDYGYCDEQGYYYIQGRKDDMIIKGGENIYPREIENVLYTHPKVKECAVIGVEHKLWGENLAAFIETVDNQAMEGTEVISFLKNQIADYKIPSEIFFLYRFDDLQEIPKGPTKKILRKELKKYYDAHLKG